jgi:excisionase family DNA binding protein
LYVCILRKLIAISEAAKLLGVHADTLRRWERGGKIKPRRTSGNLRRYDIADIRPDLIHAAPTASRKTVAYARVSSHDQKEDLERQKQVLESHCAAQGWTFELVADLGSGMNYRKRGLQKLLNQIIAGDVGRIVLNHKDRLLRFGAELVFAHL